MNTRTKKWLLAATVLCLAGSIAFAAVMTAYRWDFSRLATDRPVTNTYEIREPFRHIDLQVQTADVVFCPSEDGLCKVVCREEEHLRHLVSVQNDTLTVLTQDDRTWQEHIGIDLHAPVITVYLPAGTLETVTLNGTTGDLRAEDLTCRTLLSAFSTGDAVLKNVTAAETIDVKRSTGDVRFDRVNADGIAVTTSTGDVRFDRVNADGITVTTTTGDVRFDRADADAITVKTSTGDVTGTLQRAMTFAAKTSTGRINVPTGTTGGLCEVTTSTGDILLQTVPADPPRP